MEKYAVITGDIIDSKAANRLDLQLKPRLGEFRTESLLTPFTLSRGDEMQAVCQVAVDLPALVRQLRFHCRPFRLRIGIGIGSIDDLRASSNSWEMNGEAFYRARSSLEQVTKEKRPRTVLTSGDSCSDSAINIIYLLMDNMMTHWTEAQWEAVHFYEQYKTYLKAASAMGIARQNVQKRCYAAQWDDIKVAEQAVGRLLAEASQ